MRIHFSAKLAMVVCLLAGVKCKLASAQADRVLGQYQAQRWSSEQGLVSGRIASIAQTPNGYLWLGTEKGLIRFDGVEYRNVPVVDGTLQPRILDLTVDHGGVLWVRTEDARLLRYGGHNFSSVLSPTQGEGAVLALAPGSPKGLLIAGLNRGVALIDGSHLIDQRMTNASSIVSLGQTDDGTLWAGARDGSLFERGMLWQSPTVTARFSSKINCLLPAPGGQLWIGTDRGLAMWNGHKIRDLALAHKKAKPTQVLSLAQDHHGDLWVGTSEGLLRYRNGSGDWVLHDGTAVSALAEDRQGDIWFGNGPVLVRLRDTPWISLSGPSTREDRNPGAIYVDEQDRIWIAPINGGLLWVQNGITHGVGVAGLDKDLVYSIDGHGNDIWLGRQRGGLTRLQLRAKRLYSKTWTEKDGLAQNSIYSVRVLQDGTVWACSLTQGVSRFVQGRFTNYDARFLGSETVQAVEAAADGSVWFATTKGLRFTKDNVWGSVASPAELSTLLADRQNGVWVGGRGGLQYLDSKRSLISTDETEAVNGLAFASQNVLLVGTSDNVYSSHTGDKPSSVGTLLQLRRYGQSDGLPSSSIVRRSRALVSDAHHTVWAATVSGLASATGLADTRLLPPVPQVEDVSADGMPLNLLEGVVHVPPKSRRVTFHVAGVDLHSPEHVMLKYLLEGFDKNWSEPAHSREATYTGLPPGTYAFHVAAQNSEGQWSPVDSTINLRVEPAWFQRWDVRGAAIALFILSGLMVYRTRLRAVAEKAEARAEARSVERTRLARELHDTLLQNILGSVLHLHVAAEQMPPASQAYRDLSRVILTMEGAAEEARKAVQDLRHTNKPALPLEMFFHDLVERLSVLASAPIKLEVQGHGEPAQTIVRELSRLGSEALANAVKHSDATSISISLAFLRSELSLTVIDNGRGIEPRFLTSARTGHYGLAGMRERAETIGGRLNIESVVGSGTSVHISIPARLAYSAKS